MAYTTVGSNRDPLNREPLKLDDEARTKLIRQHVLFGDARRWRPRWFDGRFLAASDLQAEQNYFLVRQADLGRAAGSGIIDGLMVSEQPETEQLRIERGSGVTDRGELIVVPEPLVIAATNVPEIQRLDAAFGLQALPAEPSRNRTGLYVLALRLVEWTANPIGAYPTSLTGRRTVEDGTIVEGAAVTFIPYPDKGNEETWERRRARVAREIFAEGKDRGLDSGALPIAMVALRGNFIEWVDPFMVRRETGAERPAGMDFGFGARALREAHLLQYQRHLADAFGTHGGEPFTAPTYFDTLPPVGQFPAGTLDADRLTQRFFPPGIEVELSFVPEDELPALIEESLLLPPIDLTDTIEERAGIGVVVLVPLPRSQFNQHRNVLPNFDAELPRLRPASLQLKALATPKQLLLTRLRAPVAAERLPEEEPWRALLRDGLQKPLLWFVRRRHLPIPSNVAGTPVNATSIDKADPRKFVELVRGNDALTERFGRIKGLRSPEVDVLTTRLADTRFIERPALLKSLMARAGGEAGSDLRVADLVSKLAPAADPKLGEGLGLLEKEDAALGRTLNTNAVAETGVLADVDRIARGVPPEKIPEFAAALKEATKEREKLPDAIAELEKKFFRR
jgi:hypothetical protein